MRKYCLRHWRGDGQIIPDVVRDKYYDYPRNKRAICSADVKTCTKLN